MEGKAAARNELRTRMGMADLDVPIVGCVTRLVHQKGIHLIKHAAWRTLERGGQFVLLGELHARSALPLLRWWPPLLYTRGHATHSSTPLCIREHM